MDAHDAIWDTAAMRAAVSSGDLGAIVRAARQANRLTLEDVAARCGYSVSSLSRMERGKQPLGDVRVLRALAAGIGVSPHLFGLTDTPPRSAMSPANLAKVGPDRAPGNEEADPMLRRTLLAGIGGVIGSAILGTTPSALASPLTTDPVTILDIALLNPPTSGRPVPVSELGARIDRARMVFRSGRYASLAGSLPGLLSCAMATRGAVVAGDQVEAVERHTAAIYVLVSELGVKLSRNRLAWMGAERAMQAANSSRDLLTQAAARRAWGIVLRRNGDVDVAQQLILDTAVRLQPTVHHSPDHAAAYGSLTATAAYTAAGRGERDAARTLLAEATDMARLGGRTATHRPSTSTPAVFGRAAVGVYQVSIARVMHEPDAAIRAARRIDPGSVPAGEQRARYWSNTARALADLGRPEPCYRALLAAERESADEVRYRKPIQTITADLLRHPTAPSLRGLREFAARAGAAV